MKWKRRPWRGTRLGRYLFQLWCRRRYLRYHLLRRRGSGLLPVGSLPSSPSFRCSLAHPSRCPGAFPCPGGDKAFRTCPCRGASTFLVRRIFTVKRRDWWRSPIAPSFRRGTALDAAALTHPSTPLSSPVGPSSLLLRRPPNGAHIHGVLALLFLMTKC